MYPLVLIIAVGILRQDFNLPYYILPLSLLGQTIATYHYLLEKTNIFSAPTACQAGIPCTTPWINWFGFMTIPFLAMVAFFLITIFCLIALTNGEPTLEQFASTPWFQVGTVVALVLAGFLLIYQFDPLRVNSLRLSVPAVGQMSTAQSGTTGTSSTITASTESASTVETGPATNALGQQLYLANCALCHGNGGEGVPNLGTALAESTILHNGSEADALAFIRAGRTADDPANTSGQVMPPSGGNPSLSDTEINAIIAFLRGL
jgi:disulfide bond formation protein DsbB